MNNYTMWINLACNTVLTIAFTLFTIFLFGRENSFVYKLGKARTCFLKLGVAFCVAGSLYNALTLSNPPISEIVLNFGLAMLFTWAAHFHYTTFVRQPASYETKKVIVRKKRKS